MNYEVVVPSLLFAALGFLSGVGLGLAWIKLRIRDNGEFNAGDWRIVGRYEEKEFRDTEKHPQ